MNKHYLVEYIEYDDPVMEEETGYFYTDWFETIEEVNDFLNDKNRYIEVLSKYKFENIERI